MKTKEMIQRLSLFLLALVLTMPAWAQGNNGMEVVSIGSKAEWKAFCQRVNDNGEPFLNAKLTQDVDLGGEIVMLGTLSYPYSGTFDGNGHTLKFNWNAGEDNQIAPFWCVKDATIKNLRTQGKITSKGYNLSGMVRAALGTTTISGSISDVDITGGDSGLASSNAAGMVQAVAYQASVQITDCLVKGSITDNADESDRAMAGFVFYNGGTYTLTRCLYVGTNNAANDKYSYTFGTESGYGATFTDCYYLNTCGKAQGTQVTAERLKSGEMAKLLQGDRTENVWGQTLGTDLEPLPTTDATKRVYEVKFTYNGEVKAMRYATNGQGVHDGLPTFTAKDLLGTGYNPKLTYALNFGDFTATTPVTEDKSVDVTVAVSGTFPIATAADWKEFCALVNGGQNAVDAKMTADVDLGEDIAMVGAGGHNYSGTFDGQNHTLKINWNSGSETRIAPFYSVDGATIRNLRTEGSINSNTYGLSGLIYSLEGVTTISGCVSNVNLTSRYSLSSGCDASGMVHHVTSGASAEFTDCIVKGKFHATTENGKEGMGGFVYGQYGTCKMTNCLYIGKNNATSNSNTFAKDATVKNCYYLNACGDAQGTPVTAERLKSGEMAKLLQGDRTENVWGQTLGTDLEPLPTTDATKRVYQVKFTYNGEVKATRYATNGQSIHGTLPTAEELLGAGYNPKLTYALNFGDFTATTPVTEDKSVDVTVAVSGTFEIATKDDWKVFCALVAGGQTGINAKMTADVDLGTDIAMVGTTNNLYGGTFDGQNHTLTVNWDAGSANDVAPFRRVSGATIKNLRTEGAIRSDSYYLGGLIDEAIGENTVTGCVSNVNLTTSYDYSSCDAAGLICYIYTTGRVTISDCLVKGSINATGKKGRRGMGGFVYVQNGTLVMNNCLYAGTNNASGGYTFASDSDDEATTTLNNCYYLNPCGKAQGERIVEKQLKSGEVTKKLQGDRTDKCYWAQQLGEMPDFYNAADKSKANYVYYNKENNGWTCDDFRLTDGQSLPIGLDFTATKATYDRTLAAGKATLCLPYDLPVQGFKAYTLADRQESRTAVHFKEVNGTLAAYRPYLLVADAPARLDGENLQVKADRSSSVLYSGDYAFSGAVQEVVNSWLASAHAYILQDDGMFHKVTTEYPEATVPAYHAYIICPPQASGAKQLSVVLDGETTGIGDVTDEATDGKNGPVYDLQGRRVADRLDDARHQLPAGIYIVGGRKVVVK